MADILLIEDDLSFARIVNGFLSGHGYTIETRHSLREGRKTFTENNYRLVLLDYHLPDGNGLDWLIEMKKSAAMVPVIIMTSFNNVRAAVKAMREGVVDYITKPINPEELLMRVKEILSVDQPQSIAKVRQQDENFVMGTSPSATQILRNIELLAPTGMSVLIQGESGTGKENVARSIHRQSTRSKGPFVAIDCGALPDELAASELFGHVKGAFTGALYDKSGHFTEASGGTLFLDEVGNLSYTVQVKLLRVLQERMVQPLGSNKTIPTDIRVISATNDELLQKVNQGLFRKDLYHRLNEFTIQVPPLRQRSGDLDAFIHHFIGMSNKELGKSVKGLTVTARNVLGTYDWPGNLRELKNVIKRAVLLCRGEQIDVDVLPEGMDADTAEPFMAPVALNLKAMNEANEKELILKTLKDTSYNKSRTAALLNIDRKTLYLKLAKYNIER